ncbi:uncharacterized protein TNCV_938351 [Trichonephila clavipes]|nr:uncharacterized protein TNCV_938351 [Trichonephila clavipes]
MVWGNIAYNTQSTLELIRGTMTAQRYVHDICSHVLPLMQRLPGAIFQPDNAETRPERVSQDCRCYYPFFGLYVPHICLHMGWRVGHLVSLNDLVPANIMARMWFQHDRTLAQFSADVRRALDTAYPGPWIGRGGPVNWPARSPDLSCLDFFLWVHMKSFIYTSLVDSNEALIAKITVVADEIREMPGVFVNV